MKIFTLLFTLALTPLFGTVICRDLQVHYDTAILQDELKLVETLYLQRHTNNDNWTAVPLRNATGTINYDGIELSHTLKNGKMLPCKNSEILEKLPYISWIIEDIAQRFETDVGLVRISKVPGLKTISKHDDGIVFDFNWGEIYRLHVPIVTGEDVIFEIGGNNYYLMPGTLYYTNVYQSHAVYNKGLTDRIHLIIDVHRSPCLHNAILSCPEVFNWK